MNDCFIEYCIDYNYFMKRIIYFSKLNHYHVSMFWSDLDLKCIMSFYRWGCLTYSDVIIKVGVYHSPRRRKEGDKKDQKYIFIILA